MKTYFQNFVTLASVLGITACASPQKTAFPPDTNPQAKISELRDRMNADQAKQDDRFSPDNFNEAGKELSQAQHSLDQGEGSEKVLDNAGKAQASLERVEANAAKYGEELKPVTNARQSAIDAKAREQMPEELASADKDFNNFGRDIEKNDFHPEAQDISKLEQKYSIVEVGSIKKTQLGGAQSIIERAQKRDAKSKAPVTYAAAQVKYDSALRSIESNRRNPEGYQGAVGEANESAKKLDFVLNTIETSKSSESAAVKIYDQQQQLAAAQQTLTQTQQQVRDAQNQAATAGHEVATLQGQNTEYANKEAANAKIEAVKAEFSPSEADVLRDGNKIILRLKTMKFSTDRFELTQSSLETLQKVKDMIAAVPVSKVVVEGHTDSIGGEQKNMQLSQKRAETVKKYLVAENSVPADKIEAEGFGYDKPLTTNKTAQGRATNRRVDVVIETDNAQ